MHCNVGINNYKQNSRIWYTFVPNKLLGQSLDFLPENSLFLKTFDSEFWYIGVCFTDPYSNPLEIEDEINTTLAIN